VDPDGLIQVVAMMIIMMVVVVLLLVLMIKMTYDSGSEPGGPWIPVNT
jgi:heme/copper-type cytochrome/quinol oxidase subunit 2